MKKNKKDQKEKLYFLFFLLAFFISFALITIAFLLKDIKNNKLDQKELNIQGEHFNKTKLDIFFNNLTKKYSFLNKTANIEECNKLNITKERILCKEYFKQKQREILMYKPYLVFALVEHNIISVEEAIYKYQIPKEKLAEALDNSTYCFNDEKCLEVYKKFKENYKDITPMKYNIKKAWEYYQKGLLSLKNYINPYKLNCSNNSTCRPIIIED
jgi:hypothetical protein